MDINFIVRVHCITFNHAPYIEDAMNGFCMQETTFPFVCTIIDDASTDGEPEVIKKYLLEHFDLADKTVVRNEETDDYVLTFAQHKTNKNCFFAVFFLKYNHYSIKKSKMPYIQEWQDQVKYIALCEGDDYWIVPDKLQKQVLFLDMNQAYVMVCNRTKLYSVRQNKIIGENYCYRRSCEIKPEDTIRRGGLFISTCSIIYKKTILNSMPDYWKNCKVGDQPLQIGCSLKGMSYYFNEIMSVYRIDNPNSWMGKRQWGVFSKRRLEIVKSQIDMFKGFSIDYPQYQKVLKDKLSEHINENIPYMRCPKSDIKQYFNTFSLEIGEYSLKWKIDMWIRKLRIRRVRKIYTRFFFSGYRQKRRLY